MTPRDAAPGALEAHEATPTPRHRPFVLRVGLTGGIATGKTTVSRIFAGLGASILDADDIAHRLIVRGGAAYDRVVEAFGRDILDTGDAIDRGRLGRIVFADPERRALLESILHPLIRGEESRLVELLADTGQGRIAVTNAALLIETGYYRDYHRVVVTDCAPGIQLERIVRRDGLSENDAGVRIAVQMPARDKLKVAHYSIDTSHGLPATEARSRAVFRHLQQDLQAIAELG
jgi:dephospho-CoA kinase